MSQQSDSADFLGGFKPVEMQSICAPLTDNFVSLFQQTFPSQVRNQFPPWSVPSFSPSKFPHVQANGEYLGQVQKYSQKKKWSLLLKAFRTAVERVSEIENIGKKEEMALKRSRKLDEKVGEM